MVETARVAPAELPAGIEVLETSVDILEQVERAPIPYPHDEYICPACERSIPTRKQIRLAIPAKFEHALNACFKCPWCNFIFSPKRSEVPVIRR